MSDNWVVQNLQNALDTWNSKLAEIWQIITQSPENFKRGRHLERDRQYPWCAAGNRICPSGVVFRGRRGKDLRKFYRSEKTGTCTETVHPFCTGERRGQ